MNFDPRLSIQQIGALENLATTARDHGVEIGHRDFHLRFEDETRPGRGQDVHLTYVDGDHALYAQVDVYGHGTGLFVAELHAICNPAGEEICEDCQEKEDLA